jgi:DNA invertase Pin-like site-specific DNA recombinase
MASTPVAAVTAAYIRVSTARQRSETGPAQQRQAIIAYSSVNGITVHQWFEDTISGAKEDRPQLASLRTAVAAGEVNRVLVYRIDRLARDVVIGETIARELEAAGARVISVMEAFDDSPAGQLMRTMLLGFAQYERSTIAARTGGGRRRRVADRGTWSGGTAPYGYTAVGSRQKPGRGALAIDATAAEAVREVFQLRADGLTLAAVAAHLNTAGHRTQKGSVFTPVQVSRILERREVYEGLSVPSAKKVQLAEGVTPQQPAILQKAEDEA